MPEEARIEWPARDAASGPFVAPLLQALVTSFARHRGEVTRWHTRPGMRLELTKRGDYAIRAALALARAEPGDRLSVRRIAEDMSIPVRFLPQVMADLVRAGLATAVPGRNGGYLLARPAAELTLLDVIEAVEGDSRRQTCVLRGGPCGANGFCDVHDVFFAAQDRMLRTLASTTLERLPRRLGSRIHGPEHRPSTLE